MFRRRGPESTRHNHGVRSEAIETFGISVIGIPVFMGLVAAIYTKSAEAVASIFVDNPDYPSKMVGIYTTLGFAALGLARASLIVKYELEQSRELSANPVAPVISLDDYRLQPSDEAAFAEVSDQVWERIVAEIQREPGSQD